MIFRLLLLLEVLHLISPTLFSREVELRYKPRSRESIYTFYSRAETMLKNGPMERLTQTSSNLYLSQMTMQVLTNGNLLQRVGISAGNLSIGDRVIAHPSLGQFLEFVQTPLGGIPKIVGNGNQFSVKNLQFELPNGPVSIGTTWSVTVPPTPTFPVATETRYQVVNFLGDLVVLRAKTDLERSEFVPGMFFSFKGTSQIIFHIVEGLLLRSEGNHYMEVSMERKGSEQVTRMNLNSILELQF